MCPIVRTSRFTVIFSIIRNTCENFQFSIFHVGKNGDASGDQLGTDPRDVRIIYECAGWLQDLEKLSVANWQGRAIERVHNR